MKDAVADIFGWDRNMIEGSTVAARAERDKIDQWWAERLGIPHLTPRWALQHFGTNICRDHFHQDIWLASVENRIRHLPPSANIVLSDSRFVNEINLLKTLGATTTVVRRGEPPTWWPVAQAAHSDPVAMVAMMASTIHPSEWDWAGFTFDTVIDNNGTLDDLYRLADDLVLKSQQ